MQQQSARPVRVGLSTLPNPMTYAQAKRYGEKNMPADLKKAGFTVDVFVSDQEINGATFYRVNYGKTIPFTRSAYFSNQPTRANRLPYGADAPMTNLAIRT